MEHWWMVWQMSKIKHNELLQEAARFRLHPHESRRSGRSRPEVPQARARPRSVFLALRRNLGRPLIDRGMLLSRRQALHRIDGAPGKRS